MKVTSTKTVYDNDKTWVFNDTDGTVKAAYIPVNNFDVPFMLAKLEEIPFTRVIYVSKYGKKNRTPRLTWAYGQIDSTIPSPNPNDSLLTIPDPNVDRQRDTVHYRGLDFKSEMMPDWLENLAQYCRRISIQQWGFDPGYNSTIIGKYEGGDDSIAFHLDTEKFLTHHFCANVTIGVARDFQFKTLRTDGTKDTHEIKLANTSIFFFLGLEHALPKRAAGNGVRYSISFRNMANNIGIGNSFYYCRGLAGAVDNENKEEYIKQLESL